MAEQVTIGGDGDVMVGEDKIFRLELLDSSSVPVNMTGWAITFDVRTSDTASQVLITKTAAVSGTYSATRSANTQRASATVTDSDLASSVFEAKTYRYSFKRTDDGSETILAYGPFRVQRATQV